MADTPLPARNKPGFFKLPDRTVQAVVNNNGKLIDLGAFPNSAAALLAFLAKAKQLRATRARHGMPFKVQQLPRAQEVGGSGKDKSHLTPIQARMTRKRRRRSP